MQHVTRSMLHRSSTGINQDGVEKAGYVDVKFPGNIKGKRGWCRRWVVIVKLRVECFTQRRCVAKVDIFLDEDSWRKGKNADRRILENVNIIRRTPSSTHAYAFHVDGDAPLSLAGRNETETQDWMRMLRAIFMPKMRSRYDDSMFEVSVIDNCSSAKIGLNADYLMSIEAAHIQLIPTTEQQKFYQWELREIPFFHLKPGVLAADKEKILEINCRPSGEQAVEIYNFYSRDARELFDMINIHLQALLEPPYSHIEDQSDDDDVASSDEDYDCKYDRVRKMGPCVPDVPPGHSQPTLKRPPLVSPTPRSHMSPMLPVPANRPSTLKLMNSQGNAAVNDPDGTKTPSRDSGITSPACETHPDNSGESKGHHHWKDHADSLDSGTTDFDIEVHDYDDITPYQLDRLGIIGTQSNSREEMTTFNSFTQKRIQSAPDLKRYNYSSKRMAISVPHKPPPLPERNNDMKTGHDPFNKTWPGPVSTRDKNELSWREIPCVLIESPDDPTFHIGSPDESDEDVYAFHNNAEYLEQCLDTESSLSDISELERSYQDSISLMEPLKEPTGAENLDSEWIDTYGCVSNGNSDYLDMSGRSFNNDREQTMASADREPQNTGVDAETEGAYVLMRSPLERQKPHYENVPLY